MGVVFYAMWFHFHCLTVALCPALTEILNMGVILYDIGQEVKAQIGNAVQVEEFG